MMRLPTVLKNLFFCQFFWSMTAESNAKQVQKQFQKNYKNRKNNICLKFNICFIIFIGFCCCSSVERRTKYRLKLNKTFPTDPWPATRFSDPILFISPSELPTVLTMFFIVIVSMVGADTVVIARVWLNLRLIMQLIINGALHFAFFHTFRIFCRLEFHRIRWLNVNVYYLFQDGNIQAAVSYGITIN